MISDVLSDAAHEIREYLDNPSTAPCYTGKTRIDIESVLAVMDRMRAKLDAPPTLPTAAELMASIRHHHAPKGKE